MVQILVTTFLLFLLHEVCCSKRGGDIFVYSIFLLASTRVACANSVCHFQACFLPEGGINAAHKIYNSIFSHKPAVRHTVYHWNTSVNIFYVNDGLAETCDTAVQESVGWIPLMNIILF